MSRRVVPAEMNVHALHTQIEKLLTENWELKSKYQAAAAELKVLRGDGPDILLEEVATALRDANLAALASPVSQPLDTQHRHQQPHSKAPSRGKGPAAAEKGLRSALRRAVSTYVSRRENDWSPPVAELRVRCRNSKCPRHDRRTLKEVRVGGSVIQFSHCPACGGRLTDVA